LPDETYADAVAADRMETRTRTRHEYPLGEHLDPITVERLKALGRAVI